MSDLFLWYLRSSPLNLGGWQSLKRISVILNEYLGQVMHCIKRTGGILDKFIGDAVMAEWNALVTQEDRAARACETALFMIEELQDTQGKVEKGTKAAPECQDRD